MHTLGPHWPEKADCGGQEVPVQAHGWQALQGGHDGVAVGEVTVPHVTSFKHSWAPAICEFFAMNVGCSFLTLSVNPFTSLAPLYLHLVS